MKKAAPRRNALVLGAFAGGLLLLTLQMRLLQGVRIGNDDAPSALGRQLFTPQERTAAAARHAALLRAQCDDADGNGSATSAWIDFVVAAPETPLLDQRLLRALHSVSDLRISDRACALRAVVVLGRPSAHADVRPAVRLWAQIHRIDAEFVFPPFSSSANDTAAAERLRCGLRWAAQRHPKDILFALEAETIVPAGFSALLRRSVLEGRSLLLPRAFVLAPNASSFEHGAWQSPPSPPYSSSAANFGVSARDVLAAALPTTASSQQHQQSIVEEIVAKAGLQVLSPQVPGLLRPHTSPRTNYAEATVNCDRDERGRNRRPRNEHLRPKNEEF